MAGEIGTPPDRLAPAAADEPPVASDPPSAPLAQSRADAAALIFDMLGRAPHQFDFFQVLRRLEALYCDTPDRPRFGAALHPSDEPIRLGQEPSLAFAPAALEALYPGRDGAPPRLAVNFFGLLGPNGPLPLHLTEYVRDRVRNAGDPTMSRFLDLFHHRMLMMFYRAWSSSQPTVSHDRPETNRFIDYIGTMIGLSIPSLRNRDEFPDAAKLFYAGRMGAQTRNPEGLTAVIGDFFRMPAAVEPFTGDWLELPDDHRWRLGIAGGIGRLGISTTLGEHVWSGQQRFRVVLGPLDRAQFQRMLPGGASLGRLTSLVRGYVGDELRWDLKLILDEEIDQPWHLGVARLGWTSWLGRLGRTAQGQRQGRRETLVLDPQAEIEQAAPAA